MTKKIKQNKDSSVIFFTAFIVVVLVAFLFSPFAFADRLNDIDFFLLESGVTYHFDTSDKSYNTYSFSDVDHVFAFIAGNLSPNNLVFCSSISQSISGSGYNFPSSLSLSSLDSSSNLYWAKAYYYNDSADFTLPYFSTYKEGLAAVREYIDGGGGSSSGSAVLLSPSSLTVGTSSYLKSSMSDVSAVAYVDNGSSYSVVVGNINYNNFVYRSTDTSTTAVSLSSTKDFSGTTLYYNSLVTSVSSDDANLEIGVFSSVDDALTAIYQLLDTSGGAVAPRTAYDLNLDLPPGNVAFIDITGVVNDDAFVTCDLSGIALYSLSDWQSKMNYRYGFFNDIPSQFSVPLDGTILFQWEANSKATVTGTYSSFRSTVASSGSLGHYLVIVNPLYSSVPVDTASSVLDSNAYNTNNYLHIACQANNYVIVALKANIGYYDGETHYDDQSSGTQFQGTYNTETETWTTTNPDGVPASPQLGGDTNVTPESVEQESKNFIAWLKNFLKGFVSIFDAGKGAITTLVGYSADFFHSIGNLYSWLPPSVLNVLTSSLVLVFVIGVIKVFL